METPQAKAEEAPAAPLGKRSHLRKSTAVFIKILKSRLFQWPRRSPRRLSSAPRNVKPFAEINSGVFQVTKNGRSVFH
ncbi:hypothetical protein AAV98_17705 [Bacillus sp. CHD6a]|nr:hypothetical protein AAV98_17705 [Bacillus sp. CHD6a]